MTYKYTILVSLVLFGAAITVLAIVEDVWHVPLQLRNLRALKQKGTPAAAEDSTARAGDAYRSEPKNAQIVNRHEGKFSVPGDDKPADKPEQPANKTEPQVEADRKKDYIELPGGGRLYVKPEERKRIELDGIIVQQNANIELVACAEGGKDHESIVSVKCNPEEVHAALLMLGLRDKDAYGGSGPKKLGDPTKPVGDPMMIVLRWDENGNTKEIRAEDLVLDARSKVTLRHVGWVFTGSGFVDEIDVETGKPTGRQIYLAGYIKTIVATYHDPTAILDLPLMEDSNNLYFANGKVLPARGTKATLVLRPPTAAELKEMKDIQKEIEEKKQSGEKKQEPPADENKNGK